MPLIDRLMPLAIFLYLQQLWKHKRIRKLAAIARDNILDFESKFEHIQIPEKLKLIAFSRLEESIPCCIRIYLCVIFKRPRTPEAFKTIKNTNRVHDFMYFLRIFNVFMIGWLGEKIPRLIIQSAILICRCGFDEKGPSEDLS